MKRDNDIFPFYKITDRIILTPDPLSKLPIKHKVFVPAKVKGKKGTVIMDFDIDLFKKIMTATTPTVFDSTDIEDFIKSFPQKIEKSGWMIKVNGEFVKTRNGKQLWKKKSHAEAALRNHMYSMCYRLERKYYPTQSRPSGYMRKEFIDFLTKQKIVEVVQIS